MKQFLSVLSVIFIFSCSTEVPKFSAESAFKAIEKQVSFGPRNPGSKGHESVYRWIVTELKQKAEQVKVQSFKWKDERFDKNYTLRNVIASFNNDAKQRILLAAHYDTNPIAEKDPDSLMRHNPILGANDGASGTAILLEIATVLKKNPSEYGVDLVFFDGEDLGDREHPNNYCIGSKEFAKLMKNYRPQMAILLDLVGGKDLKIHYEANSLAHAGVMLKKVFDIAHDLGYEENFIKKEGSALMDDHLSLIKAGIPMIDLIDQEIVVNNKHGIHHTHKDNLQEIDQKSLQIVGDVMLHVIYGD